MPLGYFCLSLGPSGNSQGGAAHLFLGVRAESRGWLWATAIPLLSATAVISAWMLGRGEVQASTSDRSAFRCWHQHRAPQAGQGGAGQP